MKDDNPWALTDLGEMPFPAGIWTDLERHRPPPRHEEKARNTIAENETLELSRSDHYYLSNGSFIDPEN